MEKYPLLPSNPKATSRTPLYGLFNKHPSTLIKGLQPLRKPATVTLQEIKVLLKSTSRFGNYVV